MNIWDRDNSGASAIGAFFDIDGTLLPGPSLEWRFIAYLLAHDEIPTANARRWLAQAARTCLVHPRAAIFSNKRYLAGLRESLVADWEKSLEARGGKPLSFSPGGLQQIAWHLAQRHRVFLVSGTLEPLAHVAERRITYAPERLGVCATRLEVRGDYWTGRIGGEHMSGGAKARALRGLAERHGLALERSYAYGNSIKDAAMLDLAGHPRAVNPSWRLTDFALSRGWEIRAWRDAAATAPAGSASDANGEADAALAAKGAP